ncbi:MAG: DUF3298 domain-containing protein [Lachnospiraceae bacterium]|nr:DUF3298 domain-containing protein [uncultured Acetatifactor sp.]MCI8286955.1 DUF3298 domain-containing protein [Lachnospiraceae bacterium]
MIYNISEIKDLNEQLEAGLQNLKREYLKPKMSEEQLRKLQKKMEEAKRMNRANRNKKRMIRLAAAAAALAGIFVILPNTSAGIAHAMEQIPVIGSLVEVVTFRDYSYETERNVADIEVPEVKVADQPEDSQIQENLNRTTEQINAEIQEITDKLIEEFEENLDEEMGHQDIMVKSEVLTTTEEYFTLKLICYQGAGSGYAWNVYYTIDLNTGERLALKDLFQEGADYITAISENIKEQMQAQMDADENVYYWLHDEIEDWNFKAITDETSFYLNEKDNVVIGFNEGDVAPMYMGTVEFEIPAEVLEGIRK